MSVFWRPKGCVLWFDFGKLSGSTVYDLSDQGNDGTIYGAIWKRSYLTGALSFDGVDDYVVIPKRFRLTEAVTVEAWFKLFSLQPGWRGIARKCEEADTWDFGLLKDPDHRVRGLILSGGKVYWTPISPTLEIGRWYHAVETYDRSYIRLYVDGVEITPATAFTGPIDDHDVPFYIGTTSVTIPETLNCEIALVRVYNRALSQDEIKAHYHYLTKPMARALI